MSQSINNTTTAKELMEILKTMPPDTVIKYIINVNSDNGDCEKCNAKMVGLCKTCKTFYEAHITMQRLHNTRKSKSKKK